MKYQIIVIVVALILTALALTSCTESEGAGEQRYILVTTGDGVEWVKH